nr:beta-phosphoglucomutase [Shouchella shacheensis]
MRQDACITESAFDLEAINSLASNMALSNGYMGVRASHEEDYPEQTRGMYVAGIYNRPAGSASAELVHLPDVLAFKIELDGELFHLMSGEVLSYCRHLDLSNGELIREIEWKSGKGWRYKFSFHRFVSKHDKHLLATKVEVTSLDKDAAIRIKTGIDAQKTNFGQQQLIEQEVRVFDEHIMQGTYQTIESEKNILITTACKTTFVSDPIFKSKNRQLLLQQSGSLKRGRSITIEKVTSVHSSLDENWRTSFSSQASHEISKNAELGYGELLRQSAEDWQRFWRKKGITVSSKNSFDQLAIRFALFHLENMMPAHNEKLSIGAKGLTGEGYKGHVFWDTEIFLSPWHLHNEPKNARKLLRYRYNLLQQAREKAKRNGYTGALFPWESAYTGEEETPEYAAMNIRTGKRQKVASAQAEHHIAADIAYAAIAYFKATGDEAFMKKEGVALLEETARFWLSRATKENDQLVINDVIGPDEYTEHINNNAYTNYLVHSNVKQALRYLKMYGHISKASINEMEAFLEQLYLPQVNQEGLIPQDDTFLSKPSINLEPYKDRQGSQSILLDYSRAEVNELQVLKQADVVMLMYLFPDLFNQEVIEKNLAYYEKATIHDSSLSKAIHAIVSARVGNTEQAYAFFQEACLIDLGKDPHSSDEGIHAASIGSLWLALVFGFANVSFKEETLEISPRLPQAWQELTFPFHFRNREMLVKVTKKHVTIKKLTGKPLPVQFEGATYKIVDELVLKRTVLDQPNESNVEAVVFDLDGVITDTAELHFKAWKQLASEIGIDLPKAFNNQLKGIDRKESLERILIYGQKEHQFSNEEKETLTARKNNAYVAMLQSLTKEDILPGVLPFIETIKAEGLPMAIASVSRNASFILKKLGILQLFDHCVDASTLSSGKPDPEIFLKACDALNVPPTKAIGIEDSLAGMQAIKASAMFGVGVGSEFGATSADYVVGKTEELDWAKVKRAYQEV